VYCKTYEARNIIRRITGMPNLWYS